MKILACTPDLTMKDSYNLTRNPDCENMRDHVGETIAVDKYMVREENRGDTGELVTIVSIQSGEKVFATNSMVFCREFSAIVEMCGNCGETVHHVEVSTGKSKKGREYITCKYID